MNPTPSNDQNPCPDCAETTDLLAEAKATITALVKEVTRGWDHRDELQFKIEGVEEERDKLRRQLNCAVKELAVSSCVGGGSHCCEKTSTDKCKKHWMECLAGEGDVE